MKAKITLILNAEQLKKFKISCVNFGKSYSQKIGELIEEYLKKVDGK